MVAVRRGIAMWVLFAVGGLLGIVLLLIDERMWDAGGPGIIGFEIAWDTEQAQRILTEWGDSGRDAARLSLGFDFLYLVVYAAFWSLAVRAARDAAARRGWDRLARLGVVWPAAIVAAAFDALEDVCLLVELGGADGRAWPFLAALFATFKFVGLALVVGYVAVVLARRFPRVVAALAVVGVAVLVVNTVLVDRATGPAKADIGRIVSLPGGDVQVREDGPRGAPPVVLIHGYGCSMRWWDLVVPALARDLHVIRLDLLGHGGSEKPREGYSMENQADIVAQAMQRLGVRRAAIVGHSMGGIIATAFAERHRAMVTRLMMIGTPPDDEDLQVEFPETLAFAPVTGQLADTFLDERFVRNVVEEGMAPEVDPPTRLAHDLYGRTTWSSFKGSADAIDDFWGAERLDRRLAKTGVPLTVMVGSEERHTKRSVRLYNAVPGARTVVMEGLDHTPQVEAPGRTAPLIAAFARGS